MSAHATRISRRLLMAGGGAFGFGTAACARLAQTPEKITYLFPAPPMLPAFGPIQLAKGKGYFNDAGLEVSFAVGRGGVDVAKQVGAGNAPIGGIVADGPIMVRGNGVPSRSSRCSAARVHATRRARGFRHREASRSQGQDHHGDVVSGHDLLRAARACSRAPA